MRLCSFLIAATFSAGPLWADRLEHVGLFEWPSESIVGLSGLELSQDGESFDAVSDQGWYLSGRLLRTGDQIGDVKIEKFLPILDGDSLPVSARRVGDLSDAEGLAIAPDGTRWISFERWARVARFAAPDRPSEWIEDHPTFYDYADNRQLEALALHPDGTLYTFPEQPLGPGFPIYRLEDGAWSIAGHIAKTNGFSIVGADFGPDGELYILERKLVALLWWQNRVRRLTIEAPDKIETLWTGRRGAFYNLEGIAYWSDAKGPRLTLVSDNNSDEDEPTQFVEFRIVLE